MQPVMQHLGPSPTITNLGFLRSGLSELGSPNASRAIRHAAGIMQYRCWTSQSQGWAKHPDSRSLRISRILWGPMHIIYVKIETQIAAGSCIGPTARLDIPPEWLLYFVPTLYIQFDHANPAPCNPLSEMRAAASR